MASLLRDRAYAQWYRAQARMTQMVTRVDGAMVPVFAHRDDMVRDLHWISYAADTVGTFMPPWMLAPPAWMRTRKFDALRHPSSMVARMVDGKRRGVQLPGGDCEDWSALILACGLVGFARRGRSWLHLARYDHRRVCHALAEWDDADGTWTASNWRGGRPLAGPPVGTFSANVPLDSLIRFPVSLGHGQSLVLGPPEVVL